MKKLTVPLIALSLVAGGLATGFIRSEEPKRKVASFRSPRELLSRAKPTGKNITHPQELTWLGGTWENQNYPGEEISFSPDRRLLSVVYARDVGATRSDVPKGTYCHVKLLSRKLKIRANSQNPDQFRVSYRVADIELLSDGANDPRCRTYINQQNAKIDAKRLSYSFEVVRLEGQSERLVAGDFHIADEFQRIKR